jgi:hypothetical protein
MSINTSLNVFEINCLEEQERNGPSLTSEPEGLQAAVQAGGCKASFLAQISPWVISFITPHYLIPVLLPAQDGKPFYQLTGGVRMLEAHNLSEQAQKHIVVAQQIIGYVQEVVPFSGNYLLRSRIYRLLSAHNQNREIEIRNIIIQAIFRVQKVTQKWSITVDEIDRATTDNKTGNCFELSVVGYKWGIQLPFAPTIELFWIEKGSHVFLVIGRNPATDPALYKSWNADAMICDIWLAVYYPVSWIEQYLCSFEQNGFDKNRQTTYVSHFDPKYQNLDLHYLMPGSTALDDFMDLSSDDDI